MIEKTRESSVEKKEKHFSSLILNRLPIFYFFASMKLSSDCEALNDRIILNFVKRNESKTLKSSKRIS
jgi:beta-lactamase regulating signal transducer with metallopeptidase domain